MYGQLLHLAGFENSFPNVDENSLVVTIVGMANKLIIIRIAEEAKGCRQLAIVGYHL